VRTGYVYVDGLSIEEAGDVVFRDRQQLAQDGVILVVLTVEKSSGAVVAGPDLVSRGFVADDADALFEEAREHVLSLVSRLTPDAGYTAWQGAIHEGLSRFLYKKTKRRPLILPLVTEV
jgi:ribonuclease J